MSRDGFSSWGPTGSVRERIGRENPITDEELAWRVPKPEPADQERDFLDCRKAYEEDVRARKANLYHDCIGHPDLMERRDAVPVPTSYRHYVGCVAALKALADDARKIIRNE
jgi:hypothetical protein